MHTSEESSCFMSSTLSLTQDLKTRLADERTRNVLGLALPAVGEQVLNMLVGLADTFMVGHIGASAVAAVGLSNQVVMLITTFFAAVATGVTALVARHIGAREGGPPSAFSARVTCWARSSASLGPSSAWCLPNRPWSPCAPPPMWWDRARTT